MTFALTRSTENMACANRSRGRLVRIAAGLFTVWWIRTSESSVCLMDYFLLILLFLFFITSALYCSPVII
ncbi:hypothetical protein BJ138DRAFT_1142196 [Hygrophoropsis aurantiaca]|uniref:Uncharacterized protein n=1 Tax=Hygrophoropsis aurantiaca TaxID=72124 RepID=A0ACB8AP75_9AGAM|nr:hypothetical protein BJ138DRAFT_1142196 [Hygrophoropsis aurantiaca]